MEARDDAKMRSIKLFHYRLDFYISSTKVMSKPNHERDSAVVIDQNFKSFELKNSLVPPI